jgi:uncharacterized RDD family membrane protein YckC
LIDGVILLGIVVLAAVTMWVLRAQGIWVPAVTEGADLREVWNAMSAGTKLAIVFIYLLARGLLYSPLFEASAWQATFGKRILGLCVTGDDRNRIGLGRSFLRNLVKLFAGSFGGSLISAVLVASSKDRKAIHDIFAHTLVLKAAPATENRLDLWRVVVGLGSIFVGIMWMGFATL